MVATAYGRVGLGRVDTLKKEDLPTFGSPTNPALRFVPGLPYQCIPVSVDAHTCNLSHMHTNKQPRKVYVYTHTQGM